MWQYWCQIVLAYKGLKNIKENENGMIDKTIFKNIFINIFSLALKKVCKNFSNYI